MLVIILNAVSCSKQVCISESGLGEWHRLCLFVVIMVMIVEMVKALGAYAAVYFYLECVWK